MKVFIKVFIFLLILAGVSYGYIFYKNKQAVDDIFEQINFFTSASYDSTYVSLGGKSVTNGVKFTIPGTSTEATIEQIQFGASNLIESFKLVRSIETFQFDEMPSSIGGKIKGFQFPLSSELDFDDPNQTPDLFTKMQFAGCGNKTHLTFADYPDLGYNQITLDADATISYDSNINQANWNMYLTAQGYGSFDANFIMDNINFLSPDPKLKSISLDIKNDGFANKLKEYCAKRVELESQQYLERHMAYLQHLMYNEGIYLSQDFYTLYNDFINNPRSIKISSYPDSSLTTNEILDISPQLMISRLNLNLALNDKNVSSLQGNKPDPSDLPPLDEVTPIEDSIKTIQGLTLQDTPISAIGQYVNYDAQFSYRGKKYKGNIVSASGTTVRVNTQISPGNYLQMPFRTSEIRNLKIRREYIVPESKVNVEESINSTATDEVGDTQENPL